VTYALMVGRKSEAWVDFHYTQFSFSGEKARTSLRMHQAFAASGFVQLKHLKPDLVEDTMLWIEANHPIKLKIYTLGFEEALRQASLPPPEYAPDSPRYDPEEPTYQPSSPRYPDSPQREDLEGDIEAVS